MVAQFFNIFFLEMSIKKVEGINDLGAKIIPSSSGNPKPSEGLRASKIREEGEVSSSDDDENLVFSAGQSTGTVAPASGSYLMPLSVKYSQGIQAAKTVSGNSLASVVDIQSQPSMQLKTQKKIEKNQVPLKSSNPRWHAPSGGSNNLVIRFSDDDSGSESEEHRQEESKETKSISTGGRKPPILSVEKLNKLGQTTRNVTNALPKRLSLSCTTTSSTNKINGGATSRVARPSSVSQRPQVKYFNTHNKNLSSQEHGNDQVVGLNNSKLQDLRQQIALREYELKLKAAQQNKEIASASCRDNNATNLSNDLGRKWTATSADARPTEVKEPGKKRLKVGESCFTHINSDGERNIPPVISNLPSKEPDLVERNVQSWDKVDHVQKVIPISRDESGIIKKRKQDRKLVDISSGNIPVAVKHGAEIQSERSNRRVDPCVLLDQTTPVSNMRPNSLPKNLNGRDSNHPGTVSGYNERSSLLSKAKRKQNLVNDNNYQQITCGDKMVEPTFDKRHQSSPNETSLWNFSGNTSVVRNRNADIQSLVEMEEKLDKELEEAQEHRRMCEIEERNALKVYRKAQRALIEANARCSDLYRQRELFASRFRSFIVDDSSLLWSSGPHEHPASGLDNTDNVPENLGLIPSSSHQFQVGYDGFNQPPYNPNILGVNLGSQNMSCDHENGPNLGSEPCSEPDASSSEPLPQNRSNDGNGLQSPCSDPIASADDEEETFLMEHDSVPPSSDYQPEKQNSKETKKDTTGSQDTLLLEATLRSELFARLGMRNSSKNNGSCQNLDPAIERGAESDAGSEKTQMSNGSVVLSEAEKKHQCDTSGSERPKGVVDEAPAHNEEECHMEKRVSEFLPAVDSVDTEFSIGFQNSKSLFSPSLIMCTFAHMKAICPVTSTELWTKDQKNDTYVESKEAACGNSNEIEWNSQIRNPIQETVCDTKEMGSYTCSLVIDPFWPLCMYELRGKCNNDECCFQHIKDFSDRNTYQHQHNDSSSDCHIGLTSHQQKCNVITKSSKYHGVLISPTYLVGLDVLKADPRSHESVAWRNVKCWWKCFSMCLALSNLLQKDLPGDELFLDGSDGRIDVHGVWNRQSSYFQSRNSIANKQNQALGPNIQSLETALLILNQEVNKVDGIKKALFVLSRAVEADPTSETLWMVYLLILYSNMKFGGKDDDMFSHAIKHNEGSYWLWLMYINSRKKLDDQLDAYDAALTMLCNHASASEKDGMRASGWILDLFLQMMNCLCMSGHVEKAIKKIYGLFPPAATTNKPDSLMITDILTCLTISDKCIFWVSCVYLIIYRKLPDAIVKQMECEKELLSVEWPPVNLGEDEKHRALKLIEAAVCSIEMCLVGETFKSEVDIRSAELFTLSHIRCMSVLDGLQCSQNLLEKYIKLFPSCLELVLMSARLRRNVSGNVGFVGFEEALCNWPKEVPGIHCIWNQYAEYALQNRGPDFVKNLMDQWYDSVWKVQYPQNEILYAMDGGNSCVTTELGSTSKTGFPVQNFNRTDVMFGFLNLSLYKLLQNDRVEARLAVDLALKAASRESFKHCIKEHAMFLLTDELEVAPIGWQLNTLKAYLDAAGSLPVSEPLSRQFINDIEKSRVKQLVSSMLCPVSTDSSLVNLALEVWYGPSLLPSNLTKPKDLVDFVEAILEMVPSNYELVFSLCKLLSEGNRYHNFSSSSILFWASATLVNAIFCAIPIPPEHVWVEAAGMLGNMMDLVTISERFYRKALSAYPFSLKLWQWYHKLAKNKDEGIVLEAAKERGIILD